MIVCPGGPIPYAILFGGNKFLLFSLLENLDSSGEARYGLFCSDIIETSSELLPIIPLVIFMHLGKDAPASLIPSRIPIPPAAPGQVQKKYMKKRNPMAKISQSLQTFLAKKVCSDIQLEFDLICENSVF